MIVLPLPHWKKNPTNNRFQANTIIQVKVKDIGYINVSISTPAVLEHCSVDTNLEREAELKGIEI